MIWQSLKSLRHLLRRELCKNEKIKPEKVLVVGDGRTEIKAGVDMGSVAMSRLPINAKRHRELHINFGTNYIVVDFTNPILKKMIYK